MSLVYQRLVIRSRNCLTQCLRLVSGQMEKGPSLQFSSVAYIWGAGDGGQLGTGTQEDSLLPIKFPVSEEVSHIGCGYGFTLAADTSSSLIWTTGLNTFGQLGRQLTYNNLKGDISQLFFFFFPQAFNYPVMYKLVSKNVKQ